MQLQVILQQKSRLIAYKNSIEQSCF